MWLFTKIGFFSVVKCDKRRPGQVTVRARVREHLERLGEAFSAAFPKIAVPEIHEDRHADYQFRMFMAKGQWVALVEGMASAIDYGNFKGAVGPGPYHDVLLDVWTAARQLQFLDPRKV